jgi:pilus assembly protein CpaE
MLRVAILASNEAFCSELCARVERSALGGVVQRSCDLLRSERERVLRKIVEASVDVALVEIPPDDFAAGIGTIRDLQANLENLAIFAVGELSVPQVIVGAMQSGACEFLERQADPGSLLEAFGRLVSKKGKGGQAARCQVLAVMNAKGGCGATTVALNTALALRAHGSVILVDLAPLGNLAVHLDVRPTFGVLEALQNLHRMDATLLAGFITETKMDVHLLAGSSLPVEITASEDAFAQLFQLLGILYDYVVVDLSTRFDAIARILARLANTVLLVTQVEFTSLWTASRVKAYLSAGQAHEHKVRLILNRFRETLKISEADIEMRAGYKILWKIPNQYGPVARGIESGEPVGQIGKSEAARSYAGLAAELTQQDNLRGTPSSVPAGERSQGASERLFTRFLNPELSAGHTA